MNRKGITPVIGAVLLISISVAASVSAFTFLNDIRTDLQENSEQKIREEQRDAETSLNIEFAYNGSAGYTLLRVRNTGEVALVPKDNGNRIWSMFINGRPEEWEFEESSQQTSNTVSVDPQATVTLNTTVEYPPSGAEMPIEISGDNVEDTKICFHTGSPSC